MQPWQMHTCVTGQSSWRSLLTRVEHTKKRFQLLHRDKIYIGGAEYPGVIPYLPRWNQFAPAECWREIVFNARKQQHADEVLHCMCNKMAYVVWAVLKIVFYSFSALILVLLY